MTTAVMTAGTEKARFERIGWFWIFVSISVIAHAAFLVQTQWKKVDVSLEASPRVMTVQMIEVRPAPPEPVVVPPPIVEKIVELEPVLTKLPEPEVMPSPPAPVAAPPKPKLVPQKVQPAVPPRPTAPALVEARPAADANRPPTYPEMARRNGWQGLCMVRVAVDATGRPGAVSVARSSGYGILDQAALAAVRKWKFTPRLVRGAAAASTVEVPVNFSLR
jgi:protein TonB